jgi:hypothetical protein
LNLIILERKQCTLREFIEFWSQLYDEGKYPDSIYEANLNKNGKLQKDNVIPLLEWKNGQPLSKAKEKIALKIINNLQNFNNFRTLKIVNQQEFENFWELVSNIVKTGLVWKVYLLHIARPNDYPIVDQHVLRAYHYLTNGKITEPPQTLQTYNSYKNFFFKIVEESGKKPREVDKALMTFGQFLASQFSKPI